MKHIAPINHTAPSNADAQLLKLGTLVQLAKRARHAASVQELGFIMVNETHSLIPYRQAILWRREADGSGKVAAISGVPIIEHNAPITLWLNRALAKFDENNNSDGAQPIGAAELGTSGAEWPEFLPAHGVWMPLQAKDGRNYGALIAVREQSWTDGEHNVLQEICDSYAHAWASFASNRRRFALAGIKKRKNIIALTAAAIILGLMWFPVTLSTLAPSEVIAFEPTIIRAPIDGVVDHFNVQPNQMVQQGQSLLDLDPRAIENKLEIARKELSVAEAEYRQAGQQAWFDDKSRAQLAVLKGRMEQRRADVVYAQSQLERIHITASSSGLALFTDPNDWIGKPLTIGERIFELADPNRAELEIWLPVADAITINPGAEVKFFLNIAPVAPLQAVLRLASYEATMGPSGVPGYRLKATFTDRADPPRIGLKGTAKIFGDRVTVFYYLARRPLAALRQFVGL